MHVYLACFDISDNSNRTKVGHILGRYGDRVQYSVFEISVTTRKEAAALIQELNNWLHPGDSLRLYHLCHDCRKKSQDQSGGSIAHFPAAVII